jgi:hypothetical protein
MAGPFKVPQLLGNAAASVVRADDSGHICTIIFSPSHGKKERSCMDSAAKKTYSTPELTVHGSVEEITRSDCFNKEPGSSDGLTVAQDPVHTQCGS